MNNTFFVELKKYLLAEHKDHLLSFVGYYETLLQHQDSLQQLLDDLKEWECDIRHENDHSGGYIDGKFEIYLYKNDSRDEYMVSGEFAPYHYEIELLHDDRMWGYCECTPNDEGYNAEHNCCGDGCDWTAPSFRLTKIEHIAYASFKGYQKDMWELEEQWNEYLIEHKEKQKQRELSRIEERMKELQKQKEDLLGEINR